MWHCTQNWPNRSRPVGLLGCEVLGAPDVLVAVAAAGDDHSGDRDAQTQVHRGQQDPDRPAGAARLAVEGFASLPGTAPECDHHDAHAEQDPEENEEQDAHRRAPYRYGQAVAHLPRFADRAAAGRRLADALPDIPDAVVAGLTRGGVPVAAEVARALRAPLDVVVVRKVGHPDQPEYALGAVSEDGVILPDDVPADLAAQQLALARELAARLRGGRPPRALAGRAAVVVDDGLATGRSMTAALTSAQRRGAERVVVAVPVASGPAFRALAERWEAHALAVVEPPVFFAVGQFYDDFRQVDDEEVARLLSASGPERS